MKNWKVRLISIGLIGLFIGVIYLNWQKLMNEGRYSVKMATFGPVGIALAGYLLVFPDRAGRPKTVGQKVTAFLIFLLGLAAGIGNWYLMDPGYFGGR